MAGLIMGALAGAGRAMEGVGEQRIRGAIDEDLIRVRSEVEQNRTIALEKARMQIGDQTRQQTLQRRQEAKTGIINSAIDEKYADAKPADPSTWTAEQQAAVDQSKGLDRKSMENDVNVDVRAALQTGEISPKDAAALSQRDAANDTRMAIAELRNQAFQARTEAQLQAALARVEKAVGQSGGGNTDFDKKISLLKKGGLSDREIANFIVERKQPSLEDLAANFLKGDPRAGTSKAMTPEQAMQKARQLRSLTRDLETEEEQPGPAATTTPATPANRRPLSNFMK